MEQGSLRCDANVSVRPVGQTELGTKTEIKNLNSFRFVQKALEYEIKRQIDALGRGEAIVQETRLYDSERGVTVSMRSKEEAHDYRYFPEPDLPPVEIELSLIDQLRSELPELPLQRRQRLVSQYGLSLLDATELTREAELSQYFERAVAAGASAKRAASWITTELLSKVSDPRDVLGAAVSPEAVAELLGLVESGKLSTKLAKQIWPKMWDSGKGAEQIARDEDLFQQSDSGAIEAEIRKLLEANPDKVEQYRGGKAKVLGWFVGQLMRATRGKANPALVNELLKKHLDG
jgi:aspartyl-tRNA(Asn)/glutamyl-tRNA(Gln) amidotransferase subunit B